MTELRIVRPNGGHIILPRRFVDVGMPGSPVGMKGRYQLVKRDVHGIELERTPWFDNLLLTSGLNHLPASGGSVLGAAIGTDNTAPNAAQTGLVAETTYTTTPGAGNGTTTVLGVSPYNNTITVVRRTALGALNGNYSEVGVGWASAAMFSRALILDGGGSPTTISVTSAQQLDIIYQLSIYPPLVDTSNVVTISGTSYTVTGRAANVNSTGGGYLNWTPFMAVAYMWVGNTSTTGIVYSGTIGAITASPSGTVATTDSGATSDTYINNSMQRTCYYTMGLTSGNVSGGIKSTLMGWGYNGAFAAFQYEFNPVIPKDSTKTLVLHYSLNWAARP